MLFSAPLFFSNHKNIFTCALFFPAFFIFSPTVLKEVSNISPITFQTMSPNLFTSVTPHYPVFHSSPLWPLLLSSIWYPCALSTPLSLSHCLLCLLPTWPSPTLTCQAWALYEMQTCLLIVLCVHLDYYKTSQIRIFWNKTYLLLRWTPWTSFLLITILYTTVF